MAQTAAHLVDHVIPRVPVRQWVRSLPIPQRLLLAAQPKLVTPVGIGFSNALFSPRTPPAELSDTHPRGCWARHQPVEH